MRNNEVNSVAPGTFFPNSIVLKMKETDNSKYVSSVTSMLRYVYFNFHFIK